MKTFFRNLRAALRLILFIFFLIIYFIIASLIYITAFNKNTRRRRLIKNTSIISKIVLKAFNVTILCKNPISPDEVSLLVGNHIGFLDIVCLQSIQPAVFVTSLEMRNTPVLGQICDLGGCAYVNRENRMKIQDELQGMVQVLKEGFRVVLYAESRASNGEQVLPFKKTLMMSAAYSGKPIRPFVFNFRSVNGGPVLYSQRDSLCWYGDHRFEAAIWRSLNLDSIVCEIEFLPLVYTTPEQDRTAVAESVHKMISDKYIPFSPNQDRREQTA